MLTVPTSKLVVAAVRLSLLLLAATVAAAPVPDGEPPPLFLTVTPEPGPVPPGELGRWLAQFNALAMREGPAVVRLNLPGQPEVLVSRSYWAPRAGYVPVGSQMVPDPTAPPEAFSWRWEGGHNLSVTMVDGVAAGRATRYTPSYQDWRIVPVGVGVVRLRWVDQRGVPTAAPVPFLAAPALVVLMLVLGGFAAARLRTLKSG